MLGSPFVGAVLRVSVKRGVTYQWQVCRAVCRPIHGATKPTLRLVRSYLGRSVRLVTLSHGKRAASKKIQIKLRVG